MTSFDEKVWQHSQEAIRLRWTPATGIVTGMDRAGTTIWIDEIYLGYKPNFVSVGDKVTYLKNGKRAENIVRVEDHA